MSLHHFSTSQIVNFLSGSFLFSGLNEKETGKIVAFTKMLQVNAKDTIFFKGDHGNSMYIVVSGRLKIQTESDDGKTLILGFLEPNSSFGEIAVLDGKPRTASVVSVTPSELLVIDRSSFLKFLEEHPAVSIKLMGVLCQMLRTTNDTLESIVFLHLPIRLAKMLQLLSSKYGSPIPHGIEFDVKISQGDLANLVGSSRESVNKQLRIWEDEGLLKNLEGGKLRIDSKLLKLAE